MTAGNASGIREGAASVVLATGEAAERHGLAPLARLVASGAQSASGPCPLVMRAASASRAPSLPRQRGMHHPPQLVARGHGGDRQQLGHRRHRDADGRCREEPGAGRAAPGVLALGAGSAAVVQPHDAAQRLRHAARRIVSEAFPRGAQRRLRTHRRHQQAHGVRRHHAHAAARAAVRQHVGEAAVVLQRRDQPGAAGIGERLPRRQPFAAALARFSHDCPDRQRGDHAGSCPLTWCSSVASVS